MLNNWHILFKMEEAEENSQVLGLCDYDFINKTAVITVYKGFRDWLLKQPQEKTLIHELLHCIIMLPTGKSLEENHLNYYYHSIIEDLSRTLYMIKYNLSFDWFKN